MSVASVPESAAPSRGRFRRAGRAPGRWLDALAALGCAAVVFLVHDVGYVFSAPYWLDESWVVVSTRVGLIHLRHAVGPSPALWTFLLRLAVFGGPERQRIVPLIAAGAAAAMGYLLMRTLGRSRVLAMIFGAGPVLLSPAMLIRNDLKQYTADAFVFVLLLVLVSWLDAEWSRRRVLVLAVVVAVAPGLSSAALFGGTAAMVVILVSALVSRQWGRLRDVLIGAVVVLAGYLFWLFAFLLPNTNKALTDYWDNYYPVRSASGLSHYVDARYPPILAGVGVPQVWLFSVLVVAGIATLVVRGRIAAALLLPVAAAGALVAGWLHLAPFLDPRTSTWLIVGCDVVMAVGVVGIARGLASLAHWPGVIVGAAGLLAVAVLFSDHAWPTVRGGHTIPLEDTRTPAAYIAAHRSPQDVVVVNFGASYAYAYYAGLHVSTVSATLPATGFYVVYPPRDRVLMVPLAGAAAVSNTLLRAEHMVAGDPGARIWIVRSHDEARQVPLWTAALALRHVQRVPVHGLLQVETPPGD